jgi:DNA-binding IclR family transcriptional regulator
MCALRDETNITVQLGILAEDGTGLLLETAESRHPIRFVAEKGVRVTDIHAGAGWKSILAFLPETERARRLDRISYRRITSTTLTSRAALEKALAKVRTCGYAVDDAEMVEGLHCVAAPIFDRTGYPVGTLSLSAPAEQLPQKDFKRRAASVRVAAAAVSAKLGWKGKV